MEEEKKIYFAHIVFYLICPRNFYTELISTSKSWSRCESTTDLPPIFRNSVTP